MQLARMNPAVLGSGGSAASCVYSDAYSLGLASNYSPGVQRTLRQVVPSDLVSSDGTKIKVTIKSGDAQTVVSAAGICETGVAPSCATSTMSQVKFGGNNGVTIGSGATATSDELVFYFDKSKSYILTLHSDGNIAQSYETKAGYTVYGKNDTTEALTESVAGYNDSIGYVIMFSKLEVCQ
jgi:hypothetical protein